EYLDDYEYSKGTDGKWYYTWTVNGLTQQSKYTVEITARYDDLSAKMAKTSISTTKVPATTATPTANDFISAQEVEEKLEAATGNKVVFDVTEKELVSVKAFELLEAAIDKELVFETKEYRWTFKSSDITDANAIEGTTFKPSISLESPNKAAVKALAGDADITNIYFEHHGDLPGKATIEVYVGIDAANLTKYLYHFNMEKSGFEFIDTIVISEKGWATFDITHCSDYILSDVMLDESIYWPVISSFHKYEEEIVLSYYNSDKYPTFNKNVETEGNAPYWYESWTDGTNVYMLVLNRQENASEHTLDISVVSDNSLVKLTDYNVEAANPEMVPEGARVTEKYDGGFKATVKAGQAILYKIIPTTPADMSQLALFGDIANYSWAADAINAMYAQGIVNAKGNGLYEPATNITRGDFAMFLINALGLNKDGMFDGNFKDVDPYAEYAVEVAIGRKLGILKGVGDDMFNPETPITRQDLMVICARGMRVAKEFIEADGTQLDAFSDKALIADYAKADMAAMVRDGIVKGNADGTVNPLGNTTRAEAAVIMSRIFSWNK
ncbi:MAG: S-layer homology domain-containing protein, partial [Clostridia bacterium]|nr:S-layer homology domain-containing protein [Clostridia bacterium]